MRQAASRVLRLSVFVGSFATAAFAESGVSQTEIKLGQTQPYSGPVSAASTTGVAATKYFEAINRAGGINGRTIKVISLDDGYSPPKTVEGTRKLVEDEDVFAIFGSTGTPTNAAVQAYLNAKKVPQLFVISGAARFNDPQKFPLTIPLLPAYAAEGRALARYALTAVKDPKVAIIYQNDDLGRDFSAGFKSGLGKNADKLIVSEQKFEVTDPSIQSQMVAARASGANVLYFAGTQKYAAMHIRNKHELGWAPLHLVCSVAKGIELVMRPVGFEKTQGIISAAYAKEPTDPQVVNDPDVKDFLAWMSEYLPGKKPSDSGYISGYMASFLIAKLIREAGPNPTREGVMKLATSLSNVKVPLLLPGITVSTSNADYGVIKQFQIQRFENEAWVGVGANVSGE